MRFNNNEFDSEITLTRRERKALGAPSRHVAASAIGQLWRTALAGVAASRERLGPAISDIHVIPGYGATATHSSEHYEHIKLNKQQRRLDNIGHTVLAIEAETLPLPEPPAEDL